MICDILKFKVNSSNWVRWSVHKDTDNQRLTNIYIFIIDFLELNRMILIAVKSAHLEYILLLGSTN